MSSSRIKPEKEILIGWLVMGVILIVGGLMFGGFAVTMYRHDFALYYLSALGLAYIGFGIYLIQWAVRWLRR